MVITRDKVQGEKLDNQQVSHTDSIYTILYSSIDVLLVFNFKRVIEGCEILNKTTKELVVLN